MRNEYRTLALRFVSMSKALPSFDLAMKPGFHTRSRSSGGARALKASW